MKQRKVLLSLVIVAAVLFASVCPVYAIEFSAEEKYESVFIICSGNALGSGFALGSNCIVTNAHVIQNPRSVRVWSYDGTERDAQVVGMDEDQDIAVLVVSNAQFPVLSVADPGDMRTGDDVYAIGAPKSMAYTLTKGVISAKERQIGRYSYIQTDAPINEGNSGGPLLNAAGQVIGMNTLKMNDSEGIGLAIPITRVCDYLTGLGIGLDEAGNVTGAVEATLPPQELEKVPTQPAQKPSGEEVPRAETSGTAGIAWAIAGISMVGNIVLAILLVHQKRKQSITWAYDPSERTDFDIELLE